MSQGPIGGMKLARLGIYTPWKLANATNQGTPFPFLPERADCSAFPSPSLAALSPWSAHLLSAVPMRWLAGQGGAQRSVRIRNVAKSSWYSLHHDLHHSVEGFSSSQQPCSCIRKGCVWSSFCIWKYIFHEINETVFVTCIFFPSRIFEYLKLWSHHFAERERKSIGFLA